MMVAIERCWHSNLATVRATAASPELQAACRERHRAALERGFILARAAEHPAKAEPSSPPRKPRAEAEEADRRIEAIARKAYAGMPADASGWQRKKAFKRALSEAA
jgi:hypothetical protein